MTASAPSGTAPPVAIPIASPGSSGLPAGLPAAIRSRTGSRPGVSLDRRAKPSIAELSKGGRSTRRHGRLGEHARGSRVERNRLRLQRANALENQALRLLYRQERSHLTHKLLP